MEKQTQLLLIVENDPDISYLLQTILKMKTGYQLCTVTNGTQALNLLDHIVHGQYQPASQDKLGKTGCPTRLPDLVITDLNMPVMNGIVFCHTIRANPTYRNIPLIMLSAYSDELPQNLPIDYFVAKPFRVNGLLNIISQALCAPLV